MDTFVALEAQPNKNCLDRRLIKVVVFGPSFFSGHEVKHFFNYQMELNMMSIKYFAADATKFLGAVRLCGGGGGGGGGGKLRNALNASLGAVVIDNWNGKLLGYPMRYFRSELGDLSHPSQRLVEAVLRSVRSGTLVLKYLAIGVTAASCLVADPSLAQNTGMPASEVLAVRANDVTLHYIGRGEGTPILLVHGTLGDYRTWDGQLEAFAEKHQLISYSRRYHYPNEWPQEATDFSVTIHARDLAAFIGALKLPPVHLVGHSYGAFIAFLVARDHPELVRSLTLGEPPVMSLLKSAPDGDALLTAFVTTSILPSAEAFKQGKDEEGVRLFVNGVLGEDSYEKLPPDVRKGMMDNARELEGETSSKDLFPAITCEDVKKVKAPTLLLEGERSPKMFRVIHDMLDRCLVNKERAIIPAVSHGLPFENPKAFNEKVLAFIARH